MSGQGVALVVSEYVIHQALKGRRITAETSAITPRKKCRVSLREAGLPAGMDWPAAQ